MPVPPQGPGPEHCSFCSFRTSLTGSGQGDAAFLCRHQSA